MTQVLITIDTELSPALHQRGVSAAANVAASIYGRVSEGDFGIAWQMDCLDRHGLKGVFFVDPFPALVYGPEVLTPWVRRIVERGHEVQAHIHVEWLIWAEHPPAPGEHGRGIRHYSRAQQHRLIGRALDLLEQAGAPRPIAFRAGGFAADDVTLQAVADLGLRYDSSFNPAYADGRCGIALPIGHVGAVRRHGVIELPVSGLFERPGRVRPAQVCALSRWEMVAALRFAAAQRQNSFVILSHSFEMLSRDRQRANRRVMERFERLCRVIARDPALESAGFADLDPARLLDRRQNWGRLPPRPLRTAARMAAQAASNLLYEGKLRPRT